MPSTPRDFSNRLTLLEIKVDQVLASQYAQVSRLDKQDSKMERVAAVEQKVDDSRTHMSAFAKETTTELKAINERLTKLDLNGHTEAIHSLADGASDILAQTQALKDMLPTLRNMVKNARDDRIFKTELAQKFHWAKSPLLRGIVVAGFSAVAGAIIGNGHFIDAFGRAWHAMFP